MTRFMFSFWTMVLLFAFVVLVGGIPDWFGLLRDAWERSVFWPRLALFVARSLTWALCVLVGGAMASGDQQPERLGFQQ